MSILLLRNLSNALSHKLVQHQNKPPSQHQAAASSAVTSRSLTCFAVANLPYPSQCHSINEEHVTPPLHTRLVARTTHLRLSRHELRTGQPQSAPHLCSAPRCLPRPDSVAALLTSRGILFPCHSAQSRRRRRLRRRGKLNRSVTMHCQRRAAQLSLAHILSPQLLSLHC